MKTDSPIKILLSSYAYQTASWLLNTPIEHIRSVEDLNTDLPAQDTRADLLFNVKLDDGTETTLHIEIQGKSSDVPLSSRMISYAGNIVRTEKLYSGNNFCSVVIYIGKGAGVNDNGEFVLNCSSPSIPLFAGRKGETLRFHYHVIRLWEIEAETLLAMDNTALLVLIGQAKMDKPKEIIPKLIEKIHILAEDVTEQTQLLTLLAVLIEGKEGIEMIQAALEKLDVDWMSNPFAQNILNKGKAEGITLGKAEGMTEGKTLGIAEGITEGKTLGKAEGITEGMQEGLLDGLEVALEIKFGVPGLLLMPELRNIKDINTLKLVRSMIRSVNSPDEIRLAYAQKTSQIVAPL